MSDSPTSEQQLQSILSNVSVGGSLSTGDITQIFKIFVNLDQIPKPQGIPQNIISSSTDKFVGRERDLENLNQQLQQNDRVVIAAVEGMGGVGKTELAIQYSLLNLKLKSYPGGICWIRAREQDIGLQIVNFARTDLDLNPPDDLELPDRVRWCWKRWREGNTLIVLDDVKDYSDIKPYLPPQPSQFRVLITTRLKLDLPSSLYLEVLSESDALELLSQLVGIGKVEQELETAKELCQRLGYLPLALQLVGLYVKKRRISLAEELRRLEEKGLGHPSMEVPANDPSWTLEIKSGVEAAFKLSWEDLSDNAKKLGYLLSLFALAPISWNIVEDIKFGLDSEEIEEARIELENLHLLQFDTDYILHQLIREFFQKKLQNWKQKDELKTEYTKVMVAILEKSPDLYSITREYIEALEPSISHLVELGENLNTYIKDKDLANFFAALKNFYKSQGLYKKAEPILQNGIVIAQKRFKHQHLSVASLINDLALLYCNQERYDDAEPLLIQSSEIRKNLISETSSEMAQSLNNLALLYEAQGRYDEAEPLYLKSLELWKLNLGVEHTEIANTLNNLAWLYRSQGRYEDAEAMYFDTLDLRKLLLGEEHLQVVDTLNKLAELYLHQGRYSDAEPLFVRTLELRKNLLTKKHPDIAESLNNLAEVYRYQGFNDKAEPLFLEALEIGKYLFGDNNSSVAIYLSNLAGLYQVQGYYDKADKLYLKAIKILQKNLGDNHPNVAVLFNNLATLYNYQKKFKNAELFYLKALQLLEDIFGNEHPYIGITCLSLAKVYEEMKKDDDALIEYIKSWGMCKKFLGLSHPTTIDCQERFIIFLRRFVKHKKLDLNFKNNPNIQDILAVI